MRVISVKVQFEKFSSPSFSVIGDIFNRTSGVFTPLFAFNRPPTVTLQSTNGVESCPGLRWSLKIEKKNNSLETWDMQLCTWLYIIYAYIYASWQLNTIESNPAHPWSNLGQTSNTKWAFDSFASSTTLPFNKRPQLWISMRMFPSSNNLATKE